MDDTGRSAAPTASVDPALVKGLRTAHVKLLELNAGPLTAAKDLRDAASPADFYVRRLSRLAFLAPDIQAAVIAGRQPAGFTLKRLMAHPIPADWSEQRRALGF